MRPEYERRFSEIIPELDRFCGQFNVKLKEGLAFPPTLKHLRMHLDPDFEYLTYGDNGDSRGSGMKEMQKDDLLVFYGGLQPIRPWEDNLVYALVGLFVVKEVVLATKVPKERLHENAHTRKVRIGEPDIVVRARPARSGRLVQCIPIGEWRNRAYRVRQDILRSWGGLSVKDGFIQRSAVPPTFLDPERFYDWFLKLQIPFVRRNN